MTDEPLGPLVPLTPEQQIDFGNRRENHFCIQTRCRNCSTWYETQKKPQAFTEAFFCDECGRYMTFPVPALVDPASAPAIDYVDDDGRLDTGMKVTEALAQASHWWGKTGRHLIRKDGLKGLDMSFSLDPESPNYIASGILNGQTWDLLDKREKLTVVKVWHHFNVRKPQQL